MPVMIGDKSYKTMLLDTNAVSEIVKDIKTLVYYFDNYFAQGFIPCLTLYNIFELHKGFESRFRAFVELFSQIPFFIVKPYRMILDEEIKSYKKPEYSTDIFLMHFPGGDTTFDVYADSLIKKLYPFIQQEIADSTEIVNILNGVATIKEKSMSSIYINLFIRSFYPQFVEEVFADKKTLSIESFPSVCMMFWSFYERAFIKNSKLGENDINDLMIAAAIPYVEAIVTEKYQSGLISQYASKIPSLSQIRVIKAGEFVKAAKSYLSPYYSLDELESL